MDNKDNILSINRKPMNAFIIFCKQHRNSVRESNPSMDNRAVTKLLGEIWAKMTPEEKHEFVDIAQKQKDPYVKKPEYKWHPYEHKSMYPNNSAATSSLINMNSQQQPLKNNKLDGLNLLLLAGQQTFYNDEQQNLPSNSMQMIPNPHHNLLTSSQHVQQQSMLISNNITSALPSFSTLQSAPNSNNVSTFSPIHNGIPRINKKNTMQSCQPIVRQIQQSPHNRHHCNSQILYPHSNINNNDNNNGIYDQRLQIPTDLTNNQSISEMPLDLSLKNTNKSIVCDSNQSNNKYSLMQLAETCSYELEAVESQKNKLITHIPVNKTSNLSSINPASNANQSNSSNYCNILSAFISHKIETTVRGDTSITPPTSLAKKVDENRNENDTVKETPKVNGKVMMDLIIESLLGGNSNSNNAIKVDSNLSDNNESKSKVAKNSDLNIFQPANNYNTTNNRNNFIPLKKRFKEEKNIIDVHESMIRTIICSDKEITPVKKTNDISSTENKSLISKQFADNFSKTFNNNFSFNSSQDFSIKRAILNTPTLTAMAPIIPSATVQSNSPSQSNLKLPTVPLKRNLIDEEHVPPKKRREHRIIINEDTIQENIENENITSNPSQSFFESTFPTDSTPASPANSLSGSQKRKARTKDLPESPCSSEASQQSQVISDSEICSGDILYGKKIQSSLETTTSEPNSNINPNHSVKTNDQDEEDDEDRLVIDE